MSQHLVFIVGAVEPQNQTMPIEQYSVRSGMRPQAADPQAVYDNGIRVLR